MKISRNPNNVHPPLAKYVHQIEVNGDYRWLNLSGQVGIELNGTLSDDPMKQMEVALDNIKRNLKAAEMDINDLTKITFYMVGEFEANRRRECIGNFLNGCDVCMTMIYVAGLASKEIKVEIDAWACKKNARL
jgi:enamine deaminase RidA (YjgF/YER057c/UK114 family)